MSANAPISITRLGQISNDACDSALSSVSSYSHAETQSWNETIIQRILQALISESTSSDESKSKYKFAVNSTIIQHLSEPRSEGTSSATQTESESLVANPNKAVDDESVSLGSEPNKKVGRRGMHSASGAYWNNEKDGMWSHKYEGGEGKGMDIVISIMWIAV